MRSRLLPSMIASLLLTASPLTFTACSGGDANDETPKPDEKPGPEAKPEPTPPPELRPETKPLDLSGPKPPDTNVVLFAVDGALIPIACFDKTKKSFASGAACTKVAPEADPVYLSSEFGKELDTIGAPKNALCELSDSPTSLSTAVLDAGKAYDWGIWPKSAAANVQPIPSETTTDNGAKLSDEERTAVGALVDTLASGASKGSFRSVQRAEVDIDGDGRKELFISALFADARDDSTNLFSGLFLARGGDLAKLSALDQSKRGSDSFTLRGVTDLDGDGKSELWIGLAFDGGSADRVLVMDGDRAEPLGKWSCGA